VIAALASWHERHEAAAAAVESVTALPAHVMLEVYSVLTRLPSGLAVPAAAAAGAIRSRFGGSPLVLPDRLAVIDQLGAADVFGGATYDGLVALEAAAHNRTLLSLDDRAQQTYRRLGVPFRVL
jgi:predicted nucleic acid-binding protein